MIDFANLPGAMDVADVLKLDAIENGNTHFLEEIAKVTDANESTEMLPDDGEEIEERRKRDLKESSEVSGTNTPAPH